MYSNSNPESASAKGLLSFVLSVNGVMALFGAYGNRIWGNRFPLLKRRPLSGGTVLLHIRGARTFPKWPRAEIADSSGAYGNSHCKQ